MRVFFLFYVFMIALEWIILVWCGEWRIQGLERILDFDEKIWRFDSLEREILSALDEVDELCFFFFIFSYFILYAVDVSIRFLLFHLFFLWLFFEWSALFCFFVFLLDDWMDGRVDR